MPFVIYGRPVDQPEAEPFPLWIDPGSAPVEEIVVLLRMLSGLYIKAGGKGITFSWE